MSILLLWFFFFFLMFGVLCASTTVQNLYSGNWVAIFWEKAAQTGYQGVDQSFILESDTTWYFFKPIYKPYGKKTG